MLWDHALTKKVKQGHVSNRKSVGVSLKVGNGVRWGERVYSEPGQT